MPPKFKIDAFLLLIDVSRDRTEKQPISMQLELAKNIFKNMKDVKKCPVVVALTKFDKVEQNMDGNYPNPMDTSHGEILREDEVVKQVKDFFKSPGLKKVLKKQEIHVVETSSEKNVNIEGTAKISKYD